VYCKMKLNIRRKAKRRLPDREPTPLDSPAEANHTWSLDFMSDALYGGHRFRVLNVVDEGTREALDIVVGTSISSGYVVRVLDQAGSPYQGSGLRQHALTADSLLEAA